MCFQDEYEASGHNFVMYRPIIHFMKQWFVEEPKVSHWLLDGMPSSGKSVAVAALVHWARLSGWVVRFQPNLYTPAAPTLDNASCFWSVPCRPCSDLITMQIDILSIVLTRLFQPERARCVAAAVQRCNMHSKKLDKGLCCAQAVYVPNAEVLTAGGTFAYNKDAEAWDTPESAKYILHNLLAAHRDALQGMHSVDGSCSVAELAEAGLEATGAAAPVTAVLDAIDALKAQKEVRRPTAAVSLSLHIPKSPFSAACHSITCKMLHFAQQSYIGTLLQPLLEEDN